jgi:hypothetical protein
VKSPDKNHRGHGALVRCAATLVAGFAATATGCTSCSYWHKPGAHQEYTMTTVETVPRNGYGIGARDPGPIVITGPTQDRVYASAERPNQAEIAKLTSQAAASQGRENGQPSMAREVARTTADVRVDLEANRSQIAEREAARKKLFDDKRYGAFPGYAYPPDPDDVAAIDKQLGDLKAQRAALETQLAALLDRDEHADRRN